MQLVKSSPATVAGRTFPYELGEGVHVGQWGMQLI